jgi:hypothetical protein
MEEGELIYGIYNSKYHYSPRSLIVADKTGYFKVLWSQVAHCSTKHGDGSKISSLTLIDGTTFAVPISEFVTGWSGRTSQLYHGMIERWGARAAFGPKPLTITEFFDLASGDYSFAPNLEPHPSLAVIRNELESLLRLPQVARIVLLPCNVEGEELTVRSVVVVSTGQCPEALEVGRKLGASGIGAPRSNSLRQLSDIGEDQQAVELIWE